MKKLMIKVLTVILTLVFLDGCSSQRSDMSSTSLDSNTVSTDSWKTVDETKINDKYVLIESVLDGSANRFVLHNMESGEDEGLPTMPDFVKVQEIVNENDIIFYATGQNSESSSTSFPYQIECFRIGSNNKGKDAFFRVNKIIAHNLDEVVQAGSNKNCALSAVNCTFNGVDILFTSANASGNGEITSAGIDDIPPTELSYDSATRQVCVKFSSCTIVDSLNIQNRDLLYNPYISSLTVKPIGNDVILTVVVTEQATQYLIKKAPLDNSLYISLSFLDSAAS